MGTAAAGALTDFRMCGHSLLILTSTLDTNVSYPPASASTYGVNDDVLVLRIRGVLGGDDHVDEQPFVLGSHQLPRPLGGLGGVVARH